MKAFKKNLRNLSGEVFQEGALW